MGDKTGIEWTDSTWNPVTGCTKVSQGCKHCYAERVFPRAYPGRKFTDVRCHPERLDQPFPGDPEREATRLHAQEYFRLAWPARTDPPAADLFEGLPREKRHCRSAGGIGATNPPRDGEGEDRGFEWRRRHTHQGDGEDALGAPTPR